MRLTTSKGISMSAERVDEPYKLLYRHLAGSDYGGRLLVVDAGYGPLLPLANQGFHLTCLERHLRAFRLLHKNAHDNGIAQPDIRLSDAFSGVKSGELFDAITLVYRPHDGSAYIREIMALSALHLSKNGSLLLCGRKRKGVAGYERDISGYFKTTERVFSKKGIRIVAGRLPKQSGAGERKEVGFKEWRTRVGDVVIDIRGSSGLFSYNSLDRGTGLLLEQLPGRLPDGKSRILDLGCGTGVIGIAASKLNENAEVHFSDVDLRAARCTLMNCRTNRIERSKIYLSDGVLNLPKGMEYDLILSHPQLHTGRDVIRTFVRNPARRLSRNGRLMLVAARGSKILEAMNKYVGPATEVVSASPYSVLLAGRK